MRKFYIPALTMLGIFLQAGTIQDGQGQGSGGGGGGEFDESADRNLTGLWTFENDVTMSASDLIYGNLHLKQGVDADSLRVASGGGDVPLFNFIEGIMEVIRYTDAPIILTLVDDDSTYSISADPDTGEFDLGNTGHIILQERTAVIPNSDHGAFYVKDVGGNTRPFFSVSSGNELRLDSSSIYNATPVALTYSGSDLTINVQFMSTITLTQASTLLFSGWANANWGETILHVTDADTHVLTFPGSVVWIGGAPNFDGDDLIYMYKPVGAGIWYARIMDNP